MQSNELNWLRPRILHFIVSPSKTSGKSVAHCLDYDLVASATTPEEALRRLKFLVRAHVETACQRGQSSVTALLHQAPEHYWQFFRNQPKERLEMQSIEIGDLQKLNEQHNFEVGIVAALVESVAHYALQ